MRRIPVFRGSVYDVLAASNWVSPIGDALSVVEDMGVRLRTLSHCI